MVRYKQGCQVKVMSGHLLSMWAAKRGTLKQADVHHCPQISLLFSRFLPPSHVVSKEPSCQPSSWDKPQKKKKQYSPKAGHHATKQEHAVALDKGRQEGEETVDSHGDQQALFTAHFVWKPAPEEGSEHHPQIYNATWRQGQRHGGRVKRPTNNTQNWPPCLFPKNIQ